MNEPIKIAWLYTHFLLNTGGTRYVYESVKRLQKKYDITVYVEQTNSFWQKEFSKIGVKVKTTLPFSSNNPLYWLTLPYWLNKELKFFQSELKPFDLVISSMFPMNHIVSKLDQPTIQICFEPFAFFHDPIFVKSFSPLKQLFTNMLGYLYRHLDIAATQKSDRLLTFNNGVAKWINRIYGRQASGLTKIGVDYQLFRPTTNKNLATQYRNNKVLLHSTDFTKIKGTDLLIEALPLVTKKIRNLKLIITESVGDASEKKKILARARTLGLEEVIDFAGSVPYSDLPAYYTFVDAYVFTGHPQSRGATSASLSVIESLSCATPVVRSPGTDDEVIDSKTGYVVDPRNKRKFAQALVNILSKPGTRQKMGLAGRKYVVSNYSWDKVARNISSQIETLLNLNSPGLELVKFKDKTIGMIYRHDLPVEGIKFFTSDMNPFQIGIHQREKGLKLTPHVHLLTRPLVIETIQEVLFVQKGRIRLTFYTKKGKKLKSYVLNSGDSALLMDEGHGVDFLADTRIFEVKQGPYPGTEHAKLYLKDGE